MDQGRLALSIPAAAEWAQTARLCAGGNPSLMRFLFGSGSFHFLLYHAACNLSQDGTWTGPGRDLDVQNNETLLDFLARNLSEFVGLVYCSTMDGRRGSERISLIARGSDIAGVLHRGRALCHRTRRSSSLPGRPD